jgi:PAS domain-containing protein
VGSYSPRSGDLAELSDLAPTLADALGLLSSDIALVLDDAGVIRKMVFGGPGADSIRAAGADWAGRALRETVTDCTRTKVDALLRDVSLLGVTRPRHVNHLDPDGAAIPVAYTALRLGANGPVVVVGRDLRAVRAIQQRFLDAQQELERSYWARRQADSKPGAAGGSQREAARSLLLALVERMRDALVVTSLDGKVLAGNAALATLLELDNPAAAEGQPLGRWLDAGQRLPPRTATASAGDGNLPTFEASLRTERGRMLLVEFTATLVPDEPEPRVGIVLRAKTRGSSGPPRNGTGDEPSGEFH